MIQTVMYQIEKGSPQNYYTLTWHILSGHSVIRHIEYYVGLNRSTEKEEKLPLFWELI